MSLFEWGVLFGLLAMVIQTNTLVRLVEQLRDNTERRLFEIQQELEAMESIKYSAMIASERLEILVERSDPHSKS